jgi:hypothetical protein
MTPSRQRAAWIAACIAGVFLPFAPVVLGLRTLAQRDTDQLYAPVRTLVVEALRDGRLPLWNPYEATGKPLFAEGIHSVLHPVSLLAAALAPSSVDFLILGYLVAAALGAFALARALGASPPGAGGAGLAFALGGYTASMTGNLVFLAGLSTLPWLLAAARLAGGPSRWGPFAAALATASIFFSGDAQISALGLALGTLLAADAGGWRGAARAAAGMAVGILLAGVQIVATVELLPLTYRGLRIETWQKTLWALDPARLVEWIVPGFFRGSPTRPPLSPTGALSDAVFAESVYLGAPLVFAAALGAASLLGSARRRTGVLLAAAFVVLLWLALGHHFGARQALEWVPIWNRLRYSEKMMAPIAGVLCALAAFGVDAFGARRLTRRWWWILSGAAIAAAATLVVLRVAPGATSALAAGLAGIAGPFRRDRLAAGLPHLIAALAALLALDRVSRPAVRSAALAGLVALAPAVAVYFGAHLGDPAVRAFRTPLRLASNGPTARLAQPEAGLVDPDPRKSLVDQIARSNATVLYPAVNVALRVDTVEPYGAFEPIRITAVSRAFGQAWARLHRRFGLTHVALPIPRANGNPTGTAQALEGATLVQRDRDVGFELWAVPHRPWAFFARGATYWPDVEQARHGLRILMGSDDDGTVVLETQEPALTAPGRVLRFSRETERVRIEAESAGPALLVVQDAFWPGWRATIDGRPVELLAADAVIRAVRWPEGRHLLEMTYDPPEIRLGLAVSGVGAGLLVLLAALALRRPVAPAAAPAREA